VQHQENYLERDGQLAYCRCSDLQKLRLESDLPISASCGWGGSDNTFQEAAVL